MISRLVEAARQPLATVIDQIPIDIDSSGAPDGQRPTAGLTAKANLISKGWTIAL